MAYVLISTAALHSSKSELNTKQTISMEEVNKVYNYLPIALAKIVSISEQCCAFDISTSNKHLNHVMKMVQIGYMKTLY